jgi:hypothetical protein
MFSLYFSKLFLETAEKIQKSTLLLTFFIYRDKIVAQATVAFATIF